jgi:hypothetical protein
MRFAAALGLCWTLAPAGLVAQAEGSIAVGVGTVRASDGTSTGAATVTPTWRHATAATLADLQVTLAALPHGDWNAQLRLETWHRLGPIALAPALGASALPGDARAASAQLLAELLHTRGAAGLGVSGGPTVSAIGGAAAAAGARLRARAWHRAAAQQYAVTVEGTRLRGAWYADGTASVTLERGSLTATLAAVVRFMQRGAPNGSGNAFLAWRLGDRVVLEGGGGGFLADPLLGFARATAVNVGARVFVGRPVARSAAPLVARWRGGYAIVRLRVPGAAGVALAGEWAAWTPQPLRRVRPGGDTWEGALGLAPGTYRFNVVVDGASWTVPAGIATVPDGLGGIVGLLVIPPARGR